MSKSFETDLARAYKKAVRAWARKQIPTAKGNLSSLKNKDKHAFLRNLKKVRGTSGAKKSTSKIARERLIDSLKTYTTMQFGVPDRVSFWFAQHGFYLQEGYSRGHGKDNPRDPHDWYSFLFLHQKEILADTAAEFEADAAVKVGSNLGIPGKK